MDIKAVGKRIKAAREAQHLTQAQLAELVGLSTNHISVIERGVKALKLDNFVAIVNALGLSADALLVDVVDHAVQIPASDLSKAIAARPAQEQRHILKVVRALLEG